ncbi:SPARC-related modular calcium-binding protein 1-like isoform X1 [Acipenser ruthenus]|uniref:SPARC-related modular calcium-binding protein 1-like isoform X1 n=1 Tax=Acipenser ruthenus TaxID=7906 RepID=UPI001560B290|nr:SPARC-related modular calcium-binding protein 1-like isoform X1 [Acipenser ruthenus]
MFLRHFTISLFLYFVLLLLVPLPECRGQKSSTRPRWLIGDRESQCHVQCLWTQGGKPVCGSDGRNYDTGCEFQRARCRDPSLSILKHGRCKGKNWARAEQPPATAAPTAALEMKGFEQRDSGVTKCQGERSQAQDLAKKPQESVFIPECNEDGSFTQVQCHTLTGYCWCVTPDGKPVSGSSVQNKTPVCSGSVTDKPLGQPSSERKDDGSKPTPTMETQPVFDGDEITATTMWLLDFINKEASQNSSSLRNPEKVPSCDLERQTAPEEARQRDPRDAIFIPECGLAGLYKPVQCHQSTGYCWCVLVDSGRPIPGTATRYQTPECDSAARSRSSEAEDPFRDRELPGCPGTKKVEFITSLLDALSTDMVQAINSRTPSGVGRFSEPDPSHTLEERVVHWYFGQLDNNGSSDINKKELKPFKRYVKKKAKPKKCARKFTEYCDLNKDKAISLLELQGCLAVSKDAGSAVGSIHPGKRQGANSFIGRLV